MDFHIHLPTFLWQLRCFVERIIKKRLSDFFIHNSATVRLRANSSCVSHCDQRLCQTFLLQFRLLLWWVSATTDPETYKWCSRLNSVVDFGKQKCNVSLSQKPIIWFLELLFKFIRGFNAALGLSKLIVNLGCSGKALSSQLRNRNCCQSELWFDCIKYIFSINKPCEGKVTPHWRKIFTNFLSHFWSKCVLQILVWNKWDNLSFNAFKKFMVGFLFENHKTSNFTVIIYRVFHTFMLT